MDPALAAPIATVAGAVATAILMWASYNYPRGYHRDGARRDNRNRRRKDEEDYEDSYSDEDEYDDPPPRHARRSDDRHTKDYRHGSDR